MESSGVPIVLKASKTAGGKVNVPKICKFVHPLHPGVNKMLESAELVHGLQVTNSNLKNFETHPYAN